MIQTPRDAIEWLLHYGCRIKYGANNYVEVANVIRQLIEDRRLLQKQLDEIQRTTTESKTPRIARGATEGDGTWDLPHEA